MGIIAKQDWLEAQQSVLGSMLISPEIVPEVLSQMRDTDFNGQSLMVFQAIRHLFSQGLPVDVVTVRDKLGAELSPYLMQLMEITPTAANYRYYIELAKKQAKIQQLKSIGQAMADADCLENLQALLQDAVSLNAEHQGMRAISMEEAFNEFVSRMQSQEPLDYLNWPIQEMDKLLFISPGDFVIIGGRPSAGKTAFALQCAWSMAASKRVAFYSLETGQKRLTDRQVADICDVPLENIKTRCLSEKHWNSIVQCGLNGSVKRTLDIIVESSPSVSDIAAFSIARQYQVIFIDYIQFLDDKTKNATSYEHVTNISRDLHRFAQSSGCTVVALSQLKRDGNGDGFGKKQSEPNMASLKDSGQQEQDADAVLLLYLEDEKNYMSRRILKCAKNKDGERFRMMLDFDGKHQRFSKSKDFGKFNQDMAKIARERKAEDRQQKMNQMTLLPPDTPVPSGWEVK